MSCMTWEMLSELIGFRPRRNSSLWPPGGSRERFWGLKTRPFPTLFVVLNGFSMQFLAGLGPPPDPWKERDQLWRRGACGVFPAER